VGGLRSTKSRPVFGNSWPCILTRHQWTTWALPIERFKIMKKEIDIFENLFMTINSVMDGK
jgi:hypothetical protein